MPQGDVRTGHADLLGDQAGPHEGSERQASEAQAERGFEEGGGAQHGCDHPGGSAEPEPVPEHQGGRRESHANGLSEPFGGTGDEAGLAGQPRGDDPGGQLAQGTEGRPRQDPGPESVRQRDEDPRLTERQCRRAHEHDPGCDRPGRILIHRIREAEHLHSLPAQSGFGVRDRSSNGLAQAAMATAPRNRLRPSRPGSRSTRRSIRSAMARPSSSPKR